VCTHTHSNVAELVRLQAVVGAARVRRRGDAARALRPHLAAGHRALQQVMPFYRDGRISFKLK
jgi:hypothetical protein